MEDLSPEISEIVVFATELLGVEANEEHQRKALELGLVDRVLPLAEGVKDTDMVIIAIPVDKTQAILPTVLDLIDSGTTVTDMGSTKKQLVDSVANHKRRKNYVPAHPMSGTENSGPTAALEGLFQGKIAIVCDQEDSGPQHIALVEKLFQNLGMDIAYMTADEQDHSNRLCFASATCCCVCPGKRCSGERRPQYYF